ncbi:Serine carboxypeptidase 3 [Naganishia albida]|nr:Serine carboxypeptidase 3 [Naganishia albida]
MKLATQRLLVLGRPQSLQRQIATTSALLNAPKPKLSDAPIPTPRPIFPPANNPFAAPPAPPTTSSSTTAAAVSVPADHAGGKHSPFKIAVVKALAKLMGYNTKSVTAIRETGNMVGSIVRAVERDHDFWYRECALPPTYQSFFQIHLLYLLLLIPRLRSLPASTALPTATPVAQTYQTEILTHFFELAENQMRLTLGEKEHERVVRKYMKEMGEQWKGAGITFDYAIARGQTGLPASAEGSQLEGNGGDAELASWTWRNLFSARGCDFVPKPTTTTTTAAAPGETAMKELEFAVQLGTIVKWIRRELYRMEGLSDQDVLEGRIGEFSVVRAEDSELSTEDGA